MCNQNFVILGYVGLAQKITAMLFLIIMGENLQLSKCIKIRSLILSAF